jgi:hypothetical protein
MNIVNLTPHSITFVGEDGNILLKVEPSGALARVQATIVATGDTVCGIPITKTRFGEVEGLPEPEEGTTFVVSRMVAESMPGRSDLLIPNESVRDEGGNIIGCRSLTRV